MGFRWLTCQTPPAKVLLKIFTPVFRVQNLFDAGACVVFHNNAAVLLYLLEHKGLAVDTVQQLTACIGCGRSYTAPDLYDAAQSRCDCDYSIYSPRMRLMCLAAEVGSVDMLTILHDHGAEIESLAESVDEVRACDVQP